MDFVMIAGTIAAIVAAVASVKALFPKAKPRIVRSEVSWPDSASGNRLEGNIIVANNGPRACTIVGVQAEADGFSITTSAATSEYSLPRSLRGHERETLSFSCHIETQGQSPPETVIVQIEFDCSKKPIAKRLSRHAATLEYSCRVAD